MASAGKIDQIKIRRGKSDGTIEEKTYDIGVSGNVAAINVSFDDTITHLNVSNVQKAIEKLQANFQAGGDKVANACIRKGSTPVFPYTPDTVSDAILAIPTGTVPTGTYEYNGILTLPAGKTLIFYQEKDGSTSQSGFGYIHATIIGGSSFSNNIAYDGTDTYSGSVTIS